MEDHMTKQQLIEALQNETGHTKPEAEAVVNLFFNEITDTLAKGDRVELRGFCSFSVKQYKAYTGRNPQTGVSIQVESKKLPVFNCGRGLREPVNK
jgi:integration host factor subunit beta